MGLFDWFKESKRKSKNVEVEKTAPKQSSFCADYIRREEMYTDMLPEDRRNIFTKLFFFSMATNIRFKAFVFSKKHFTFVLLMI